MRQPPVADMMKSIIPGGFHHCSPTATKAKNTDTSTEFTGVPAAFVAATQRGTFDHTASRLRQKREAARAVAAETDRLTAEGKTVKILTVGKKGREQLRRDYGSLMIGHVDLSTVKGTGVGGRIRKQDVLAAAEAAKAPAAPAAAAAPPAEDQQTRPAKQAPRSKAPEPSSCTCRSCLAASAERSRYRPLTMPVSTPGGSAGWL